MTRISADDQKRLAREIVQMVDGLSVVDAKAAMADALELLQAGTRVDAAAARELRCDWELTGQISLGRGMAIASLSESQP